MATGLLVFHIVLATALIGIILLQRSEGGGLGTSSSTMGGFMTTRGTANLLTRTTSVLAGSFFATTIVLALLFKGAHNTKSILDDDPLVVEQAVSENVEITPADPIQDADAAMSAITKKDAAVKENPKTKSDETSTVSVTGHNDHQNADEMDDNQSPLAVEAGPSITDSQNVVNKNTKH